MTTIFDCLRRRAKKIHVVFFEDGLRGLSPLIRKQPKGATIVIATDLLCAGPQGPYEVVPPASVGHIRRRLSATIILMVDSLTMTRPQLEKTLSDANRTGSFVLVDDRATLSL